MNMNRRQFSRVPRDDYNAGARSRSGTGPGGNGGYGRRASRPGPQDRDREVARNRTADGGMSWKKMDLHLHTPASSDYRDPGISYLDILKKAEEKGLDMIAFADHNTVAGYAAMHREIETLTLLEKLDRLRDEERTTLSEYRRLMAKIVVLPAFEFTATFGFHILGIFPENTSTRKLEYLLLDLNVPEEKMVAGAPDVGYSSDVLRAYQVISAAGGLAIAAHANSSNGVAMQGFPLGGQTKIAYTQDPNLAALEVTDLESTGRRTTASFFNGSKPEYPRRMHIIQGSDAHSLNTEQSDSANKRLGVGARVTEIFAKEASFNALKDILMGNDFTRTRPHRGAGAWDFAERARSEGPNIVQSFHERAMTKTSRTRPILHDIAAFANTNGGTVYVGVNQDPGVAIHGVERPEEDVRMLRGDVQRTIEPPLEPQFVVKQSGSRAVILITVPKSDETPYVYTPTGQIFVRDEDETAAASRDEIIALVQRGAGLPAQEGRAARKGARPSVPVEEVPMAALPSAQAGEVGGRAAPVPTTPASPQTGRWGREDRPQGTQSSAETRRLWEGEPQKDQQEERPGRAAALANLPPEKLKGKTQPMLLRGMAAPIIEEEAQEAQPTELAEIEQVTAPLSASQVEQYIESAATAPAEPETLEKGKRSRSRKKAAEPAAQPEAPAPPAAAESEPAAEPAPARRGRGRSRRGEAAPEAPVMEATVSSEHETREEIVAESAAKPKRGRRKASTAEAELEVEAPTAAAAASGAGREAILTAAAVEPGAQIPGELPNDISLEPRTAAKGKSRRKKGAEARVEAAPAPAVEEAPKAAAAAPAEKKSRRGRKGAAAAEPEVPSVPVPTKPPDPPSTGVEIVATEPRNGTNYHTMRDLRNKSTVHNVTRHSARRLWHYAILQHERGMPELAELAWHPDEPVGIWRRGQRAGDMRYDLVSRNPDGSLNIYYGVTEEGLHGPWTELVTMAEEANYWGPDPSEN